MQRDRWSQVENRDQTKRTEDETQKKQRERKAGCNIWRNKAGGIGVGG